MNIEVKNKKLSGKINAITSKSYAQRALFLSLLAKGTSEVQINTWSEDIESSLGIIKDLGCKAEKKGYILYIIPPEKFSEFSDLNAHESGTALRLLIPSAAVLGVKVRIKREGSLASRTNKVYFDIFPEHGVNISEDAEFLEIWGKLEPGKYEADGNISSQFISGLMIALGSLEAESEIKVKGELQSRPYVNMTIDIMRRFGAEVKEENNIFTVKGPYRACRYKTEGDWSNALFLLAAGAEVCGLNDNSLQGDKNALEYLYKMGYENMSEENYRLEKTHSGSKNLVIDASQIPDAIPVLSVMASLSTEKTEVVNIERLRLKESDRVKSTMEMLDRLGVLTELKENSFIIYGTERFRSCEIDSCNDHRIVMSSAVAALFSEGSVTILNAEAVNKSYRGFFEDFKRLGGDYIVK